MTTMRLAVMMVGLITMVTVLSTAILLGAGRETPEGLIAVAAGGVGALATLLTGSTHADRAELQIQSSANTTQALVTAATPEAASQALTAMTLPESAPEGPA
jgi:hypothetical protein